MRLQREHRWQASGWETSGKEGLGGRSVDEEDAKVLEGWWKGGIVARDERRRMRLRREQRSTERKTMRLWRKHR